jgi:hypothetical protein
VSRLLTALAPGLHVFVGQHNTEQAIAAIRRALGQEGGP